MRRAFSIVFLLGLAAACGSEDETNNKVKLESAAVHGAPHKFPTSGTGSGDVNVTVTVTTTATATTEESEPASEPVAMTGAEAEATETETAPTESESTGGAGGGPTETTEPTGGYVEPTECDPAECAAMNNACWIYYCSGTNPWCFNAYRDDDYDGAASCPGEVYGEYGSTFYPGAYDCNDYNAAVRPGNSEVCADALDNDCDGQMDSEDSECAETGGPECGGAGSAEGDCGDVPPPPTVTSGWYECEVSPDTPRADIILAGTTPNVLTVRCKAHGENVKLDTFSVSVLGNPNAVAQAEISEEGGTPHTTALSDGWATFTDVGIMLAKEVWTYVHVSVALHPLLPTYPVSSGDTVQLTLGSNKGRGQDSGEAIYFIVLTESAPMGNQMVIHKTRPTVSLASGSPSGPSIPGEIEVLQFNMCADSRGDVYHQQLPFRVEATDNANSHWADCNAAGLASSTKWNLYDLSDSGTPLSAWGNWFFFKSNGEGCVEGEAARALRYAILTLPDIIVPAGTCSQLSLRLNANGATSGTRDYDGDALHVTIPSESEMADLPVPQNSIVWCDDAYSCGNNGEFIRNLPVLGGTILF